LDIKVTNLAPGLILRVRLRAEALKIQPCSLKPQEDLGVPDETRRVAMAAFPKGCACLRIGDVLGCVYEDKQFEALFPRRGQPAEAPGRLALATVLQFTEGFSDRQAADAVRARIDWKYALGLELTDAGFDHTVLSEFRTHLVEGKLELVLLDKRIATRRSTANLGMESRCILGQWLGTLRRVSYAKESLGSGAGESFTWRWSRRGVGCVCAERRLAGVHSLDCREPGRLPTDGMALRARSHGRSHGACDR